MTDATPGRSGPARAGVRRAGPADAAALVALRTVLMRAMGETDADDPQWQSRALDWFVAALSGDAEPEAAAFVVDDDHGTPVSCALVTIERGAPSARNPHGTTAHLSNVCTRADVRGRGYARACVEAAIAWSRAAGVNSVSLHATPDGESLYRSLGFTDTTYRELRLRW